MSMPFFRKTQDTGNYDQQSVAHPQNVPVADDEPFPVRLVNHEGDDTPRVQLDQTYLPPIEGHSRCYRLKVPGIGTAAPYADGDAFGTTFQISGCFRAEKGSGWLTGARLIDLDDEGFQVDVHLFSQAIAGTADNGVLAPSDAEMVNWLGAISIDTFFNLSSNQGGQSSQSPMHIVAGGPHLYCQLCVRGAANIAAGAEPWLVLFFTPD